MFTNCDDYAKEEELELLEKEKIFESYYCVAALQLT